MRGASLNYRSDGFGQNAENRLKPGRNGFAAADFMLRGRPQYLHIRD